jgi:hypothetical protein
MAFWVVCNAGVCALLEIEIEMCIFEARMDNFQSGKSRSLSERETDKLTEYQLSFEEGGTETHVALRQIPQP